MVDKKATEQSAITNCISSLNKLVIYLESREDCESLLSQLVSLVIEPFNSLKIYKAHDGLMQFLADNEYNFPTDFDFEYWNLACRSLTVFADYLEVSDVDKRRPKDDEYKYGRENFDLSKGLNNAVRTRRRDRQILLLKVLETTSYRYNCELNDPDSDINKAEITLWELKDL